MSEFPAAILSNVVADIVILALLIVYRRLAPALMRRDPSLRPIALLIVSIVWATANLLYIQSGRAGYMPLFLVSTVMMAYVVGGELWSFWRVGLVGADQEVGKGLDYSTALQLCRSSLDFLGVGAAKLTAQTGFRAALQRCHQERRPIRLLLCDPDSARLILFARQAGVREDEYRRRVIGSLRVIAEARLNEGRNIEVRFYPGDAMPLFRLMFIDDALCLASHYRFGKGDGSDLPQLHIRSARRAPPESSIYFVFHEYFGRLWEEATPWDFKAKI